jgi:predicted NAD/FAD-binding protein
MKTGPQRVKIAIIGAGISGLTAAYYLSRDHEIELFEANNYIGGHTNTIDVELDGVDYQVDTGFIVYNDRTYPNFSRMLAALDVETQTTSMTFSVQCEATGLEYRGVDLAGFFAQRRNAFNPRHYGLLFDFLRFNRTAAAEYPNWSDELTVGEFFQSQRFGNAFRLQYFLPMASAIWSCPQGTIEQFPIKFIVEFYRNHGLLSVHDQPTWRVIHGGSRCYVESMLSRISTARIHTSAAARAVVRADDAVTIQTDRGSGNFDHVIFACHSDQALRILANAATPTERELLGAFPYERNSALLHTDTKALPACRRAWASWNYFIPQPALTSCGGPSAAKATVTYNMNLLQGLQSPHVFCVTLNGEERVHPDSILRRMVYYHPVFTTQRNRAQRRHRELLGPNRTSFCGAYWGNGFHEDGVNSAFAVCRALREREERCKVAFTRVG